VLRVALGVAPARALARRLLAPRDPALRVHALGLDLPSPIGLAAGFDKDATTVDALGALGFGFVEVGTVTAQAQPGNPRPRMFRLPADRALVNRMGFNNAGARAAARRLGRRSPADRAALAVGVNIGKTKVVPPQAAGEDYRSGAGRLAPHADYLVLNVSSPNTPGLRDLQAVETLEALIGDVRAALAEAGRSGLPLLVKIAPDLADEDIDAIADLAVRTGLDGLIATNTTIAREGLVSDPAAVVAAGDGGLSGAPLGARSLAVLRRLHERVGDRVLLVAVGGVTTPSDVVERLGAGATLVQAYTGFVYGGPLWPWRLHRGVARALRAGGFESVADLRRPAVTGA
jgi:dihydroorotate dehydrogenase